MEYKNLTILMYTGGKFAGNSISFDVKKNSLEVNETKIAENYWDSFQKAKEKVK